MRTRTSLALLAFAIVTGCGGKIGEATVAPGAHSDSGTMLQPGPLAEDGGVFPLDAAFPPPADATAILPDSTILFPGDAGIDGTIEPPGEGGICLPQTCDTLGVTCGTVPDQCGDTLSCGPCGFDSGGCPPATCQQLGLNCGAAGDQCGNVIQCGTCAAPDTCGGGGFPDVCGSSGTVDAAGTWTGPWTTDAAGISGTVTLQIAQQGATLSGTVAFANEPCFAMSTLTATLSGESFSGSLANGAQTATLTGSIAGDSMTGTATATAGSCMGDTATFTATR
jgi:hypothetical protein